MYEASPDAENGKSASGNMNIDSASASLIKASASPVFPQGINSPRRSNNIIPNGLTIHNAIPFPCKKKLLRVRKVIPGNPRASVSRINTVILALDAGKHPSGVSRVAAHKLKIFIQTSQFQDSFLLPQANERFQPQKDLPQHPESSLHRRQLHESPQSQHCAPCSSPACHGQ